MITMNDYTGMKTAWCPGCGNFGILIAVKKALVELNLKPHQVLFVSGIGQAGKLPHYTRGNVLNMLHGRTLPAAAAAKLVNPALTVIAEGGDGDGYGEGGNHWLHAMRHNHNLTYLVHNNQVYGLTKGQASPTSDPGFVTKSTPQGVTGSFNPIVIAIAAGVSFAARGFAGDPDHLSQLIQQGIRHPGFSLIDILQPCVTFNEKNTFQWYQERVYKMEEVPDYDPGNLEKAFARAQDWEERIPIGVIYKKERDVFGSHFPALAHGPLIDQLTAPHDLSRLLNSFL
jgi:2-oxoglutarate ferredoxin oxidoreductase subunit beta